MEKINGSENEEIMGGDVSVVGVIKSEGLNRAKLYIACSADGSFKDIFFADGFMDAFERTIAKDSSQLLLEIDINTIKEYLIKKMKGETEKKSREMKKFLLCSKDGRVIEVITAPSFEEAYDKTIALNNGELLIEINEETTMKLLSEE